MYFNPARYNMMPLGIVLRRTSGMTRWQKWSWNAVAVIPGAPEADWRKLRQDQNWTEYHATTLPLELHGAETEAYLNALSDGQPSVFVVLRPTEEAQQERPSVLLVTASPYEAQDYADSGEETVEKVSMPTGLIAWIRDFVDRHHEEEAFVKRKRDRKRIDAVEDGVGDARIRQDTDVYRAPRRQ